MNENRINPLLAESPLPYGAPVFDRIEESDYLPAFREAIDRAKREIQAIVDNPAAPDFANTIEAYEASGEMLGIVAGLLTIASISSRPRFIPSSKAGI